MMDRGMMSAFGFIGALMTIMGLLPTFGPAWVMSEVGRQSCGLSHEQKNRLFNGTFLLAGIIPFGVWWFLTNFMIATIITLGGIYLGRIFFLRQAGLE